MKNWLYYALFVVFAILLACGVVFVAKQDAYLCYAFSDFSGRYDEIVYISDRGEKVFHEDSKCRELRKYYISIEAKDALLIGYEPCLECCKCKEMED